MKQKLKNGLPFCISSLLVSCHKPRINVFGDRIPVVSSPWVPCYKALLFLSQKISLSFMTIYGKTSTTKKTKILIWGVSHKVSLVQILNSKEAIDQVPPMLTLFEKLVLRKRWKCFCGSMLRKNSAQFADFSKGCPSLVWHPTGMFCAKRRWTAAFISSAPLLLMDGIDLIKVLIRVLLFPKSCFEAFFSSSHTGPFFGGKAFSVVQLCGAAPLEALVWKKQEDLSRNWFPSWWVLRPS